MKYIHHFILNKHFNGFISDQKNNFSSNQIIKRCNYLINFLIKKKVKKGFKTLIIIPSNVFIPISITAVSFLGGIFSIVDENVSQKTLKNIIDNFKPEIIIKSKKLKILHSIKFINISYEDYLEKKCDFIKKVSVKRSIYDIVSITYTSGSTGSIKGVMSNHQNIIFSTTKILEFLKYKNVKIGCFLPLSFDYGLYQIFLAFKSNSDLYLGNTDEVGIRLVDIIKMNNINCLPLVENLLINYLNLIKRYPSNHIKLKIITNTGSSISKKYIENIKLINKKLKVFLMYGLTECKRVSILDYNKFPKKINSVGKALKSTKCWVVNKKKERMINNDKGELVIEGKNVMQGYFKDKILTEEKFTKINKDVSRLYTGDVCKIDKEGFIYFFGRKDDIFKNKNYRISKLEVENNLKDIRNIEDLAIIIPNNKKKYSFFIKTEMSKIELIKKIKKNLDFYKIAEKIFILKKIPRNNRGKIDEKKLLNIK